jgi:hypothetical protein
VEVEVETPTTNESEGQQQQQQQEKKQEQEQEKEAAAPASSLPAGLAANEGILSPEEVRGCVRERERKGGLREEDDGWEVHSVGRLMDGWMDDRCIN